MKHATFVLASALLAIAFVMGFLAIYSPVAEAASGGYVKRCGGGKVLLKAKEKKTLALHNKMRMNHGLRKFCVHPKLQRAARTHSKDMIRRDYFSHNTKGGGTFDQRLRKFGYKYTTAGENIAYGQRREGRPGNIMRSWKNSKHHRGNILNRKFREVGIGTYVGNYKGRNKVTMYTVDFGRR